MPKVGFKSLTMNDHVYNNFEVIYKKHEKELREVGINTFTGFVTSVLSAIFKNDNAWNDVIESICINNQLILSKLKR